MSKIYDCFNFFNELDILELRLNILNDYVDYFVIVESDVSHSGEKKQFNFEINKSRYNKFIDKIIYYKITDTPNDFLNLNDTEDVELNKINEFIIKQTNRFNRKTQQDYGRDFFQKESVRRPLINCNDDDIILFSDLDEIPNPEIINELNGYDLDHKILSLRQNTYYYYLNVFKQSDWYGTKILKYKNLKDLSLNEVRGDVTLSDKIDNGGWHFSFMGGKKMVEKKLTSYSAKDLSSKRVLESIEYNIENNIDPFFRGKLETVEIDNTFPEYLRNNINSFNHLIK
jgi:beta-1,4-mannosyl-glycoprotein beta-1,4-N-acetylglucosaminyltransferase